MKFERGLREGEFLKRYKRFFADVRLSDTTMVAHVPNTGSLKSCLFPGAPCLVTESKDPNRKLKATLHFLRTPTSWVGVDTSLPNRLAFEDRKWLWSEFKAARPEYKISKATRLDLALAPNEDDLAQGLNLHFVEIKNVTYAEGNTALFPDAVTERGHRHLLELMNLKKKGFGAEILFVVQRQDCTAFAPADTIDPEYGRLLRQAREAGVAIRAFATDLSPKGELTFKRRPLSLEF